MVVRSPLLIGPIKVTIWTGSDASHVRWPEYVFPVGPNKIASWCDSCPTPGSCFEVTVPLITLSLVGCSVYVTE